ncbi:hypothetical protein [Kribbella sp. NPDC023855]|uniref:hypothetical protein n=1 Tax=Kribbella sp. NPDC023855 TaxID=3154698 RepID=UPI0033C8CB3E
MTPEQVFLRLVHGVADRDLEALPALYAEQTDNVAMARARGRLDELIAVLREPAPEREAS